MDFYLERLQQAIASATAGMRDEALTRHPEGKWSAAEILEHLLLTYRHDKGLRARGRIAPKQAMRRGLPMEVVAEVGTTKISPMDAAIASAEARPACGITPTWSLTREIPDRSEAPTLREPLVGFCSGRAKLRVASSQC